jgi:hypothetical protein
MKGKKKIHQQEKRIAKQAAKKAVKQVHKQNKNGGGSMGGKRKSHGPGGQSGGGGGGGIPYTYAVRPPKTYHKSMPSRGGRMVFGGLEYFCNVSTLSTNDIGDVLVAMPMTPSDINGSRLTQQANLYEFYKWKKLEIIYVPSLGTTSVGQLVAYFEADPDSIGRLLPSGSANLANVRTASAHEASQPFQIFTPATIRYSKENHLGQFWNDQNYTEARTSVECVLICIQQQACSNSSTVQGAFYVKYEVEMWGEEMNSVGPGYAWQVSSAGFNSVSGFSATTTVPWSFTNPTQSGGLYANVSQNSNLPVTLVKGQNTPGSLNVFSVPQGCYFVLCSASWSTSNLVSMTITADNGATWSQDATIATAPVDTSGIVFGCLTTPFGLSNAINDAQLIAPTGFAPGFNIAANFTGGHPVGCVIYVISLPALLASTNFDDPLIGAFCRLKRQHVCDRMLPPRILDEESKKVNEQKKMCERLMFVLNG